MQPTTRRAILAATAIAASGTLAAAALFRKPPPAPTPSIITIAAAEAPPLQSLAGLRASDAPAPPADTVFLDAEGAERRIGDFAGQGLVINLWATWCVPCVAEMPALQAMARALAAERIAVLALSSDRGGAPVVQKFYAAHGIDALPVWLDPKGAAARAWGARGLPTTLIIDRQGREVARAEGAFEWGSAAALAKVRALIG
ncbi:MAG: TlpA disulfide reductase family protein [Alphaproteobacteria bacterium]|nr:TlpA disulfide reductase family protein [Alphaproteobacteria bacterium]